MRKTICLDVLDLACGVENTGPVLCWSSRGRRFLDLEAWWIWIEVDSNVSDSKPWSSRTSSKLYIQGTIVAEGAGPGAIKDLERRPIEVALDAFGIGRSAGLGSFNLSSPFGRRSVDPELKTA